MENQEQLVTQLKAALYDGGQQITILQSALAAIADKLKLNEEDRTLEAILDAIPSSED